MFSFLAVVLLSLGIVELQSFAVRSVFRRLSMDPYNDCKSRYAFASYQDVSNIADVVEVSNDTKTKFVPTYSLVFAANKENYSSQTIKQQENQRIISKVATKDDLMKLLQCSSLLNDSSGREKDSEKLSLFHQHIASVCDTLQQGYIPAQTIPFLDMIHRGTWEKVYSSAILPPLDSHPAMLGSSSLRLNFTQLVAGEDIGSGTVLETIHFQYQSASNRAVFSGELQVWATYNYTSKGHMSTMLTEHVLIPADDATVPNDIEGFVSLLQRAIPYESFDPNNLLGEVMYADGDTRIIRWQGENVYNLLTIYRRAEQQLIE